MKKWRVFIALFILITPSAFAGNAAPQFKDYPVTEVYTGKNHPLVLDEFGKSYRTRLREAIRNNKPDFAGHYIVVKWTIGPLVVYNAGAVIDAKTGRAYSFPVATGSAFSEKEVDYFQDHLYKKRENQCSEQGILGIRECLNGSKGNFFVCALLEYK